MSFDLYADEVGKKVDALPLTTTIAPGIFDNFFTGTGQVAMQGFAKTARAASRLAAIPSIAVDKVMGGTTLQDSYFATSDPIFQGAVDFWTPKPNEVGVAAEVAGSLISQLPLMIGAPSLAVAGAQTSGAEDVITAPGITSGQALAVGAAQGIGLGIGIWAPPALGYNLASKAATGAGVNWLQGVLTRGASSAILGDNPVAKNYEPFGAKDQAIDVLLGLVFGAASQYVPSWKAEAESRTDQINVPAQRAIAKELGQTTQADLAAAANLVNARSATDRAERLKAWAESATPTQKAGLAVARLSHHMQFDSAPGRATSPVATNDHVTRLREAIDSLVRDGTVPPEPTVSRETLDQFTQRVAVDIAGNSELASTVQLLQRAYIEQGPEAGRVMLDEMVAQLPEPDRPPGFADEVHQQLTERAQEWQEKQAPAFVPDPEREAFASQQTRAMQEAATRIAADEGLPPGPTILQPIREQLKAHLTETGFRQADGSLRKMTPAEADQYIADHAALDEVNLRQMAAMTGGKMTPEQLLHRYLSDVKMRTTVPEGALEQRMTPAMHIADFKPTVQTSQYGGTRYGNAYLELGNSVATGSKGEKGERRTFEIMDKSGGRAATVGFVIVEIDSKGKFAALRNIEIRKDIRTKGLGENVVATMVAHNGPGYTMDIVDITHGGKVGTDEDALPFWKKVGTQLKNYSRNPDVQMDGMLSLEDYLGARSGQGLAAGRGGSAAQAVPANRAGAGAAGSGVPRGGPSAADRAELARLNGDSLFQGVRAHFFLEMLDDLSREFPAAEAEMQVLFKEWSLDRATWDTMTLDDKRWYHEQFARSWEAYLMSNKAPTPELRSVFRRFRDWLLAIYNSAQSLNVKISAEMRELFDRLHGSELLDPSTDPAAKAAASGSPPPPQPGVESQRPPGTVDPFADMPVEPQPFVPRTLDDQEMREHLRYMVDNEVGWAQVGGKNLTGQTGTANFSTWIPRAEWWTQRPENIKKLKEAEYETAVAKALVGDKLKPIEQRAVDFMLSIANERMRAEQAIGRDEWNNIARELVDTGLEPTTKNVVDADAVAIANQIDEGMVERLAIQYDADDVGFMAEIRRMIDDHQNPEAPAGGQEAVGQAPEGVPAARPAAQPGPEASTQAAGSDGVDLLAQEADRFIADNPTLTLEFEMPDGSTQKMTAAEYMADVRESAAMAREDVKLIHEAAQCLLGAS